MILSNADGNLGVSESTEEKDVARVGALLCIN